MTEELFIEKWHSERPMYEAWGQHVVDRIIDATHKQITPLSVDIFLRIPPKPRLKGDASLVEKAYYRSKNYADPYADITDKVGARFVVLLTDDIKIVEEAIVNCEDWEASKDRDFEEEQEANPIQFDYAAVHYVVRASGDMSLKDLLVKKGTPCEVQVKTILQHAYSELTHDTIYKPKLIATPLMKRTAAKSMALIEATNDYFKAVVKQVADAIQPSKAITDQLSPIYFNKVGHQPETTRAEGLILDAYEMEVSPVVVGELTKFLDEKPFIGEQIAERAKSKLLFRQPSILLLYFLSQKNPASTKRQWPLTPEELRPIYVDLGLNFDSF